MARAKSAKSAKFSTQWKPLSAFFHTMEAFFGKFSTPWNPVSPVFPHNGSMFSTVWKTLLSPPIPP